MTATATQGHDFARRGMAGVRRAQYPPTPASEASTPRVIHMLINRGAWTLEQRPTRDALGGGYDSAGGYWETPETANTRRTDLEELQVNNSRRVLAGIGGCSFEVFTSEHSTTSRFHVFADPRFTTPANTRHHSQAPATRSHHVNTQGGAR